MNPSAWLTSKGQLLAKKGQSDIEEYSLFLEHCRHDSLSIEDISKDDDSLIGILLAKYHSFDGEKH